jgi:hypothetical protein
MEIKRCESWILYHRVYKQLTDMCLRHHRTKKHLEDNYATTFRSMSQKIFITNKLYQRSHDFRLEGDIWEIDFLLHNDNHEIYSMTMIFPVTKWSRIYKLNQLGI